jgi:hypothetical protein
LPEQELDSAKNSDALSPSVAREGFPALMELLEIWYPFLDPQIENSRHV